MNLRNYTDQLELQVNQMQDLNVAKWLIIYSVEKTAIIIYNYQYLKKKLRKNYKHYLINIS